MNKKVIDIRLIEYLVDHIDLYEANELIELLNTNCSNSVFACIIEKKILALNLTLPKSIRDKATGIRASNLSKLSFIKCLAKELEEVNIKVYLLKGMSFNNNFYDNNHPRGCSDIDILATKDNVDEIKAILSKYGTESVPNQRKPHSNSYESSWIINNRNRIYLDLHWYLLPPSEIKIEYRDILDETEPHPFYNSENIHCLSKAVNYYHLLLHMYKDANLLQQSLYDSIELSKKFNDEDWAKLDNIAQNTKTEKIINFLIQTINKTLNNKIYTFTEKIISTENKIPIKLRKLILKYKFSKSNIEFIKFIINYAYTYTRLKVKL